MKKMVMIDDDETARLTVRRLLESDYANVALEEFSSGKEALEVLWQRNACDQPDLILLDLEMPSLHGFDVLAKLKSDVRTVSTPVVIFSASGVSADIKRAYELGANTHIAKPKDLTGYRQTIGCLIDYWCNLASSPR